MKEKITDLELTVKFKSGKVFTYRRVIDYTVSLPKGVIKIVTRNITSPYTRILDLDNIETIEERQRKQLYFHE